MDKSAMYCSLRNTKLALLLLGNNQLWVGINYSGLHRVTSHHPVVNYFPIKAYNFVFWEARKYLT